MSAVRDRGAVTAETALVLPVLVAVTIGLVWLLSLAATQLRVVDAARETARAAARGDSASEAIERGLTAAPGASITVVERDGQLVATVVSPATGPGGLWGRLPGAELSAVAVAVPEGR